jgi:methylamine dehydrogenase accessory protein MauD
LPGYGWIERWTSSRGQNGRAVTPGGAGRTEGQTVYELSSKGNMMSTVLLVSSILLWLVVLFVVFLLLGTLRALEIMRWRLEQVQAIAPSRMGRSGLKPGKKAPPFTLSTVAGESVSLDDYAGRKVFLVFVQAGCAPCHAVVPDLNWLHQTGKAEVLVVNNATPEEGRKWVQETKPAFRVLLQEKRSVSRRYEVMATPFAFLIDEQGVVASKGLISNKQHIGFVLDRRHRGAGLDHVEAEDGVEKGRSEESHTQVKEVEHV